MTGEFGYVELTFLLFIFTWIPGGPSDLSTHHNDPLARRKMRRSYVSTWTLVAMWVAANACGAIGYFAYVNAHHDDVDQDRFDAYSILTIVYLVSQKLFLVLSVNALGADRVFFASLVPLLAAVGVLVVSITDVRAGQEVYFVLRCLWVAFTLGFTLVSLHLASILATIKTEKDDIWRIMVQESPDLLYRDSTDCSVPHEAGMFRNRAGNLRGCDTDTDANAGADAGADAGAGARPRGLANPRHQAWRCNPPCTWRRAYAA
jgi:hypothetical protein